MIKLHNLFLLLITLFLVSNCTVDQQEKSTKNAQQQDRNMFGLRIKRGLTKTSEGLADGYIMFTVPNSGSTYLVNRKGEVVKEWKGHYVAFNPKLTDNGAIYLGGQDPDYPTFGCCGPYGRIQKVEWDNRITWDFEYANIESILHHDFHIMPNGHILAIAYEVMPYEEAIAKGRKPDMIPSEGLWMEKIIEIEPHGKHGGKVVWEWHVWDHLIQNNDPSKQNYGNPADHPELLDFGIGHPLPPPISADSVEKLIALKQVHQNTTPGNRGADTYHFNAVNYNASLDQIVISSPSLDEILIIDHGTTTQEAAGHKGGKSGKGGDYLYRWGNPENYARGDSTIKKLYGQHDVRWIENGNPGAGNLTVFNNNVPGFSRKDSLGFSAIFEIVTPVDANGNYVLESGKTFGPESPVWIYTAADSISFFSGFISGAHRMNNGNTFINEGAKARFFEVTPDGKIVWEYLNPYHGEARELNGDPINPIPMVYSEFRATFIPADHPALAGKELKPLDPQPKPFVLPPPPKPEKK